MSDDELKAEDRKVVDALRFAGIRVDSVYDLVNSRASYTAAIPILVRMLREVQHPRIREGIARALSVKEARDVAPELVGVFRTMRAETGPELSAKWAVGNALAVAGSDAVVEGVIDLMRDPQHGWARAMLPLALAHAKKKRDAAVGALIDSLDDELLACQAADALARLKASEAIAPLQRLASHSSKDIQKAAKKALKRLEG